MLGRVGGPIVGLADMLNTSTEHVRFARLSGTERELPYTASEMRGFHEN
jgi:hypothetical protein